MKFTPYILLAALAAAGSVSAQGTALRTSPVQPRSASLSAGPASATTQSNSTSAANSTSRGGAALGVGSQGQSLSIDSHAVYQAQARNPVATAVSPPLTSSNDTCMGSTSIGGSAVSFGFSAGTTWTDENCVMLKNAREIWNMGFKGAALARLCMDKRNREAFELTGINCPVTSQEARAGNSTVADSRSGNRNDDLYRY
ncbi:hypothetical protein [Noviherbaspirillum malthae]|jgi:hypothetical protein|uniref:hypothetical protein n=1 Tax=Noviherbaspirillum malthae TaxID=1260987 RepID=UPI001E2B0135|nr:hypothetical protein [Noviherbaspirillum malthae]